MWTHSCTDHTCNISRFGECSCAALARIGLRRTRSRLCIPMAPVQCGAWLYGFSGPVYGSKWQGIDDTVRRSCWHCGTVCVPSGCLTEWIGCGKCHIRRVSLQCAYESVASVWNCQQQRRYIASTGKVFRQCDSAYGAATCSVQPKRNHIECTGDVSHECVGSVRDATVRWTFLSCFHNVDNDGTWSFLVQRHCLLFFFFFLSNRISDHMSVLATLRFNFAGSWKWGLFLGYGR